MRGSIKLFNAFGISVNIHVTFFILLLIVLTAGLKALFLIVSIFCLVTMHELTHSLVARYFGINVREITLLPIGGIASMAKMPEKPSQEFAISIAGPLFNLFIVLIFYFPMRLFLGKEVLHQSLRAFSISTWPTTFASIYWVNLILAAFNLIPAFPMDGGRVLRALLARRMGYQKATKIAVNFGHFFALIFGYIGILHMNFILVGIAIFIYMAASGEEMQVDAREVLKKFRVRDILSREFLTLSPDATLAKVLELMFHTHQEDFIVVDGNGKTAGFVTRQDVITNMHKYGTAKMVVEVMRTDFPMVKDIDTLAKAQIIMQENNIKAVPVQRNGEVIGVITLEDVGRVYSMMSSKH